MSSTSRTRSGALCVAIAMLAMALSACGSDNDREAAKPRATPSAPAASQTPSVAPSQPPQSRPMAHADGPAHVDLIALTRSARDTVTARFQVVNDGDRPLRLGGVLADTAPRESKVGTATGAGGIALVDGTHRDVYYPLSTIDGTCLCTELAGVSVAPGQSHEVDAVFPAPRRGIERVMVWFPLTPPFSDVAIGGDSSPPPTPDLDPQTAPLSAPVIRRLISTVEGTDQAVDEDGRETSVRLSADVLFAVNRANLTPRSEAVLRGLAKKIDASRGQTVRVDGHTDSSGNDAINEPLSRRRAGAVQTRLRSLVKRPGVEFQAIGHGSRDPVADNTTEEGRRKNRRVTVTFSTPPVPPSRPSAGSTPSEEPPADERPVVASVRPRISSPRPLDEEANNLRFDINSLHRDAGGLTTLVWTVTNVSEREQAIRAALPKWQSLEYAGPATSGARLVGGGARLSHWPLRDSANACLCTTLGVLTKGALAPGENVTYADVYRLPDDIRAVDVELSWYTQRIVAEHVALK